MACRPRRARSRHVLNAAAVGAAPAARRTCCWRIAVKIATVMLAMCKWRSCEAAQRTLMDITDHVEAEDLELSGNCGGGCVRQVVDAVAPALGEIDCELRVENLLDHTDQDVAGGSLNVVHSCSDADGNLLYQVRLVRERKRERDQRGHISTHGRADIFEALVSDRILVKPIYTSIPQRSETFSWWKISILLAMMHAKFTILVCVFASKQSRHAQAVRVTT